MVLSRYSSGETGEKHDDDDAEIAIWRLLVTDYSAKLLRDSQSTHNYETEVQV
jgi:hypothetical protein